ncbi:MAG TPA: hypothetical protein VF862_06300 [Gemmatimonadales bacterium]
MPRRPALLATLVFLAAALTLCWPMLTGQFLLGSDQYVAGYGFRLFGAEHFRAFGEIPQWNPYLFGGLPFMGAMHGDIFYPTAWLRWVLPVDTAMNLGFAVHIVLAGATMYALLRTFGVSWAGALAGGLAYELTGIVASLVQPGHDGKLFVSALTPLLFLAILRLVRDQRLSAAGMLALTVGLSLHGHPQMSYYLLVAGLCWGLYLTFLAPDRPARHRVAWTVAAAVGGVAIGFGLYAIQALPFIEYIPYSPRGEGGSSGGWDYATAFSMPVDEMLSLALPEFNGILDAYWGRNFFKLHTEYVGVLPLALAILGAGDRSRRTLVLGLGAIAGLFLLVSFGGHTPFYRLWYEVMPMMKKVRAPGMAFFLVAFVLAVFAGFGVDRISRGEVTRGRLLAVTGGLAGLGLLAVTGALQGVAEAIAPAETFQRVRENADALQAGGVRMLLLAVAAGGLLWAMGQGRLAGARAAAALAVLLVADLYSIDRRFFEFHPPAAVTYRDDEITSRLRQTPLPYRTLDVGVYRGSWLMAHQVPTLLGYHGNEIRFFDDLMGGKNQWQHLGSPALWDLYAVRYLVTGQAVEAPGWTLVMGPVPTTSGVPGYLYEAEAPPQWARVVPAAAKVPEAQIVPTVIDPRFPANRVVLFPDTASITPAALGDSVSAAPGIGAELRHWQPGRMTIGLLAQAPAESYLLVSENWYPDWTATVDGRAVTPLRGQGALLTVPLPAGAREVELTFESAAYSRGRLVSLLSALVALGLLAGPLVARRRRHG